MEIDFVACPKCGSRYWGDIPDVEDVHRCKYRCLRCNHLVVLGSCSRCKTQGAWVQTKGIEKKGGLKPYYRYECRGCKRVIGVLID